MALALAEFEYLQKYVEETSSIIIGPGQEYLVESRLADLAYQNKLASVQELLHLLRVAPASDLHAKVLDAMTNNETWFFRDQLPFEALRKRIIPEVLERNADSRKMSIWSAAASTGQEAYSIAMLLEDDFGGLPNWEVQILGTDISEAAVQRARQARYGQMEVSRGLSAQQLQKYFSPRGNEWQVHTSIRQRVHFQQRNLFHSWYDLPSFDIIFLRNVLIYFEVAKKKLILSRVPNVLRPGGYLVLGGAETTYGLDETLERINFGERVSGQMSYYQFRP
ncbi:MAG: CheR family methyltransferase [Acidobacteriaceae bacterium]